jgi:hypothetical protein
MKFTRTILSCGVAIVAAAALSACGSGTSTTTTAASAAPDANGGGKMAAATAKMTNASTINVTMEAQNGSKQTGTATVTAKGTGVQVMISLTNEPKGASEPAHIHDGTCAKLNPAPWKPLTNVVNGTSSTTVAGVTVAELQKEKYAINVHKSAADLKTYVSCGNL